MSVLVTTKRTKSPGTQVAEFKDFLGNTLRVDDHVLVFRRDGNTELCWSGLVLDINEVKNPYYPNGLPSTKVLVQATGAYSSYRSHQWPTEKDYRGLQVWTGEYPRATWISAEKVVASPCTVELIQDGTVNGLRQVKDLRCCV